MLQFLHDFIYDKGTFCWTIGILFTTGMFYIAIYNLWKSELG